MPVYRIKHTRTEPPNGATSLWAAQEDGTSLLVAVVETPALVSVFDNHGGKVPFPSNLVFTGDKAQGLRLLLSRYGIAYVTPKVKERLV